MNELTHLDLFSGIGGFALAARWNGFRTLAFCDNEPYAQAVLKKHWPDVPCHRDIREIQGNLYAGVTLLTGGFPCQPFSVAGKQRGKGDDRYLWPEMLRVIREARPAWIIGENVAGIVNMALDQVHTDLEAEGYEVESLIVPACGVDAPHRRDRVWIVANVGNTKLDGFATAKTWGCVGEKPLSRRPHQPQGTPQVEKRQFAGTGDLSTDVADTNCGQLGKCKSESQSLQMPSKGGERIGVVADSGGERQFWNQRSGPTASEGASSGHASERSSYCGRADVADLQSSRIRGLGPRGVQKPRSHESTELSVCGGKRSKQAKWLSEPGVGRVAHGIPNRVAKLRGLGNAIVPQVAAEIVRCIRIVHEAAQTTKGETK
jgi:DNA (cytosine-5)-methyltransferase 1